ncbi:HAD family hydrolase [Bacillus sp. FJAT-27225]|uniref:HAD-IIA family hydrolase n=1 Tax=Bacillus sp. FJAT-27225 TaxID=1743144 RepID=UPI00080C3385|nr:HAD-IIA family hydrolase [Bacillus sp. FJAT-27225]OCA84512.1 HAD family hydrolase [Bacillus sp. FJAT-27225]
MVKGFIFDLDGTVYLDDQVIDGAVEAINSLRDRGHKVIFLTNKSIATRYDYVNKLNKFGIQVSLDEVINSNFITVKYLKETMKDEDSVLVIGEEPLFEELKAEHIKLTDDPNQATHVVLGWDRQFNYEKLNAAYQAWINKATILATNPDRTCPVYGGGEIPDCGAMIGALEGATGQPIDFIIGKPSRLTAEFVINEILQLHPDQCFMVGDRLETDIRMGVENGLNTVLVLTGITTADMVKNAVYKPTYVLDSIKEITKL